MRFIYLLGGFPGYLERTLAGSVCWSAIQEAYAGGAVVGGSSAGAMVLCDHYYEPYEGKLLKGLGLIPGICVLPHFNTAGRQWVGHISTHLPGITLVGIDERTGALNDGLSGSWTVYGAGSVTKINSGQQSVLSSAQTFRLP
jgi:cyanophycinase